MNARTPRTSATHAATLAAALVVALLATACSRSPDNDVRIAVIDHIAIDGDHVQVRGDGRSARIGADGAISIDGKPLTLSAAQQAAGREFYAQALGIRRDGAAIGKAGADMAGQVLATVAQDLRNGQTDQTEAKIEAQAAKLQDQAMRICQRVETLRRAQQQLTEALPQFQPFARVVAGSGEECRPRS